MTGKRDKGSPGGNPWVNNPDQDADDAAASAEPERPVSPWDLEVPPPPSPWADPNTPGPGPGPGPGPATETSTAWGEKVGPPSLRRPPPEKTGPRFPPLLIPIGAGLLVLVLVAVALILLSGGNDKSADPTPTTSSSPTPSTPTTSYQPPANALPVGFGVSLVPVEGYSVVTSPGGKQVATYAPNGEPRAFFWVRQKQNVTAQAYLLGIVEGETQDEIAQLGNVRNLPCPKDVLVECVAITYTSVTKDKTGQPVNVKGYVEAYRRKDNVVTALDFRTRVDFAQKADADAETMKKSVLDSL